MSTVSSSMSQHRPVATARQHTSSSTTGPTMRASAVSGRGALANPSTTSTSSSRGTSILGLLASKRFARQFASRIIAKRGAGSESQATLKDVELEPTYRMEPDTRFQVRRVESTMQQLVQSRMQGFKYTPKVAAMVSKILTSEIKDAVKEMAFERYKVVCVVTIGQNNGQDVRVSSRCSWDTRVDTSATYTWNNANVYCCATVYGIYHE